MTTHTETSLKALTVPKLKELLVAAGLAVAGKKDELIARLLATPSSLSAPESAPAPTTAPVDDDDVPEVPTGPPSDVPTKKALATPAAPVLSAEELAAKAAAEDEKRKKRAERFGVVEAEPVKANKVAGGNKGVVDEALSKRAERFGLVKEAEAKGEGKVADKSLAALDRPLGDKKAAALTEKKAPAPKKEVDPLVAATLAADEEKKRKRAERFGGPETKKVKVDV